MARNATCARAWQADRLTAGLLLTSPTHPALAAQATELLTAARARNFPNGTADAKHDMDRFAFASLEEALAAWN